MKDIIREGHPNLTKISKPLKLPISKSAKQLGLNLLKFCVISQNSELNINYDLRPGVGLSAVQVNVLKRIFAIHLTDLDGTILSMIVANPKITYRSKEMIYLNGGEGCLSVDRETKGLTPRHKEIRFEAYIYNPKLDKFLFKSMTLKDYPAIVFQHEYDHLNGILYVSKLYDSLPDAKPLLEEKTLKL
ncbi:MAG: peptide deformylase [Acholeplasmataceae bacterium]|jgi:peptide deformylase|nr:peptide deformylase [Acholeplasmataceae bacterium]